MEQKNPHTDCCDQQIKVLQRQYLRDGKNFDDRLDEIDVFYNASQEEVLKNWITYSAEQRVEY